ncbi:MAG: Spy/CpxP family protein refolding chaperone [Deltaproteobacteria bacterium]|nr:Spy/CpxP family protein refolding chaperone [Deltaproteobacteria bacterium]
MKRIVTIAVILTLTLLGTMQPAGAFGNIADGQAAGILNDFLQINLTDAQKHAIAVILKSHQDQAETLIANLRTAGQNLRSVVTTPNVTEAAVRDAYRAVAAAGEELVVLKVKVMAETVPILTQDQQNALAQLKKDRQATMQNRISLGKTIIQEWINLHSK